MPRRRKEAAVAETEGRQYASLNPDDFSAGGAQIEGVVTFTKVRTVMFDYGGGSPAAPQLCITCTDEAGNEIPDNYWSAGNAKKIGPSDDGHHFISMDGTTPKVGQGSKTGLLIASLIEQGFPKSAMTSDVTCMEDLMVELVVETIQLSGGGRKSRRDDGSDMPESMDVSLVSKIIHLPGEGKKPVTTIASPAKRRRKPAGGDVDYTDKAKTAVGEALKVAGDEGLTKKAIVDALENHIKDDAVLVGVAKLVADADWLEGVAEVAVLDGGKYFDAGLYE